MQREDVKPSPGLASWLFCYVPLHNIWYGVDELLAKVEAAISQLQTNGQLVTQYTIGAVLEMSPYILKGYQQVRTILEQFEEGYCEHLSGQALLREEALLAKVEAATAHFISRNEAVTLRAVSKVIGVPTSILYYYPSVRKFLKNVMSNERKHRILQEQMREDLLVLEVLEAIEYLTQQGKRISVRSIVRIVGSPLFVLKRFPRTKAILDQVVPQSKKRSPHQIFDV